MYWVRPTTVVTELFVMFFSPFRFRATFSPNKFQRFYIVYNVQCDTIITIKYITRMDSPPLTLERKQKEWTVYNT